MAIKADFYHDDGFVGVDLFPEERRMKVGDDPCIPGYDPGQRLWFYWDDDKLADHDEYEFVMVEVNNIRNLRDEDLAALDHLDIPRIDVPDIDMFDVRVSDVLRWARETFPGRTGAGLTPAAYGDAVSREIQP